MNILFHLTSPEPPIPGTDAVLQEIETLRRHFGGECLQFYPLRRPSRIFPKCLYGVHQRAELRRLEPAVDLHHLYYATLYSFAWLGALNKPLIYSLVTGVGPLSNRGNTRWLKPIRMIVSGNPRDEAALRRLCPERYRIIRPGIALERFTPMPLMLRDELILLVGSAPWTKRQFRTKGVDLLLAVAESLPLRLVFLWRGFLRDELERRIARRGLTSRVEIINEAVDVNQVLARVHATVVLAETDNLVKAYPHSLMESLAAGKPVLVNERVPMADYVAEAQCGQVVSQFTPESLKLAIARLMDNYGDCQAAAFVRGRADFQLSSMLAAYGKVYKEALEA
ncbi:MAG: glycosyltransferase [Lentisphaerae bacterium]|nr:glycosyltransferase [Lentisphaerota bacterium]